MGLTDSETVTTFTTQVVSTPLTFVEELWNNTKNISYMRPKYAKAIYTVKKVNDRTLYRITPVSDIKALAHLLRQGELLRLREPQKWILRPIWGLERDRYVFASYHPYWLVTTPGVLISGHIGVGVIFSGRKGGYL